MPSTLDCLVERKFLYDSSMMASDHMPYRVRHGDVIELEKPAVFGKATKLIEMPVSWTLDDYPHFEFVRTPQSVLASLQSPRAVMQTWYDEFVYMRKTVDWGVLTLTMHPFVIGRGQRMAALELLVDKMAKDGAVFMTMEQAAEEAKTKLFSS